MLFDLQGRRKTAIKAIYLGLAILMAGGLVLFGIGSNVSGGLSDVLTGGSGDGQYEDAVNKSAERVAANPKDVEAWEDLIADRYSLAGLGWNEETQTFDKDAQKQLDLMIKDWLKYQKLVGEKIDLNTASYAVNAYVAKEDAKGAQAAQTVIVELQPNAANYLALMRFALSAGDSRIADASAIKAEELATKDQEKAVAREIKQLRKLAEQQGQAVQKQIQEQLAEQQNNQGAATGGSPFGGLGAGSGSGTQSSSGN